MAKPSLRLKGGKNLKKHGVLRENKCSRGNGQYRVDLKLPPSGLDRVRSVTLPLWAVKRHKIEVG